jgi:FkbM family methyltransferase
MSEREQTAAFVSSVREGDVFFDIGANVGYYSILGSRIVGPRGKVFAIEPAIANIAALYRHVTLNRAANVSIVTAACSDRLSLAVFQSGVNSATGHLAERAAEGPQSSLRSPVPTLTVDAIVQETDAVPDVLKIDVEGAELSVLRGAEVTLRQSRPIVFLSTHSDALRSSCLRFLEELGYVWRPLGAEKHQASEFLARHSERRDREA